MAIAQWHAMWDVRPEREKEYVRWVVDVFKAYWKAQPGLRSFRGFWTVVGDGPLYVAEFDFDDAASLAAVLACAEWRQIQNELLSYVTNYTSRILQPTGRGDDQG
ncbi:MAG: hypothetical protein HY331_01815 [Chloroflexi bacterium]|nr:hypothetical protein [Chloroflexota bacterium]